MRMRGRDVGRWSAWGRGYRFLMIVEVMDPAGTGVWIVRRMGTLDRTVARWWREQGPKAPERLLTLGRTEWTNLLTGDGVTERLGWWERKAVGMGYVELGRGAAS